MSAQPTLPILTCLSDEPRTLTREERIEILLREDAEAKTQIDRLTRKRADLKELLKALGEDAFDRWYFQEHGEGMTRLMEKEEKRLKRRAAFEERQREVEERRAGMNAGALANLQDRIATLNEQTKEERKQADVQAVVERKAGLRNRLNGS
jgi:hypothetical protein